MGSPTLIPPPPGFKLDDEGGMPPPPPGFNLDEHPDDISLLGHVLRGGVRGFGKAIIGTPEALLEFAKKPIGSLFPALNSDTWGDVKKMNDIFEADLAKKQAGESTAIPPGKLAEDVSEMGGRGLGNLTVAAAVPALVKGVPAAARGVARVAEMAPPGLATDIVGSVVPQAAHAISAGKKVLSIVDRIRGARAAGSIPETGVTAPPGLTESWARSQGSDVVPRTPQFEETPPAQPIQLPLPKGGAPIRVTEADPRTRTLPDGRKQVLKEVPINQIQGDPGNKIFEPTVAKYQKEGYTQPAELRPNPDGGYTIWEGHHRILADVRNGADSVKAWVPDEGGPVKAAPPVSNAPLKPEAATASKTGIANVEDEARTLAKTLHGAGITSADVPAIKPADWREISKVLGISQPGMDHVARVNFYMKKFENAAPAAKAFASAVQ